MKPHKKRKPEHVFVAGTTGGGKTVTANEMHAEYSGLSIFFNSEEESNVVGFTIHKPQDIITAIQNYGWNVTLDYIPTSRTKEGLNSELDDLINFLFRLTDKTGRKHYIQLVVDECQDYAEEGKAESTLHMAVRKGRKRKLKVIPLSQDPATVSKVIVRQCKYNLWCGEYNPFYEPYFRRYNLPTSELKQQKQTYYAILEKAKIIKKHCRANSRYA